MTDGRAGLLQHVGRRHLAEALGDDEVLRVRGLDADHLEAVVAAIRSLTLVGELEEEEDRGRGGGSEEVEVVTSPLLPTPLIVSVSSTFTATAVRATQGEGVVTRGKRGRGGGGACGHVSAVQGSGGGTVLLHSGLLGHHDGCASGQQ